MNLPAHEEKNKVAQLPLEKMDYSAKVEGTVAHFGLNLSYKNKLERPVEPIFTFPLPPEATVLGVKVKVGGRVIQSELKKAAEAKKDYDQAVNAGHHATMLEQTRDNIFTMSVGGIEPGEDVEVAVDYSHPCEWQQGGGRLIVPLVVAPHFIHGNPLERSQGRGFSPDTDQVPDASRITPIVAANPDEITYRASVRIELNPGFEAKIASPTHDALFEERIVAQNEATTIELHNLRPDRDLTITYQGNARLPQIKADKTVRHSPSGQTEDFTLIQVMPGGATVLKPREVVLCLDCSGSMGGLPIEGLRSVVRKAIEHLKQSNEPVELGIVKFNSDAKVLLPLQRLTPDLNVEEILSQLVAAGGTRAGLALNKSVSMFQRERNPGSERSIIFVTDGDTSDMHYDRSSARGIRVHSVGLSTAVDHAVLKDVARESGGSTYWVYPGENYDTAAREIVSRTHGPLIRSIKLEGLPIDAEVVGIQDVYLGQPVTIGIRSIAGVQAIRLQGESAEGGIVQMEISDLPLQSTIPFAHTAWARMRIREERDDSKVTDLSLTYGVLARTTSFIAVMERERPGEKPERIEIPVSLPHGWEMEAGWNTGQSVSKGMFASASSMGFSSRSVAGCRSFSLCGDHESVSRLVADFGDPSHDLFDSSIGHQPSSNPVVPQRSEPHLIAHTRDLLQGLKLRSLDEPAAMGLWNSIEQTLKQEGNSHFAGWDEQQKAELYRMISELRGYGYKTVIPADLRSRPQDPVAFSMWKVAERALGIQP